MHPAETDLTIAFREGAVITPSERGHIAVRTDGVAAFQATPDARGIPRSDHGTAFAGSWHRVFFHDPEGKVIEVLHQVV